MPDPNSFSDRKSAPGSPPGKGAPGRPAAKVPPSGQRNQPAPPPPPKYLNWQRRDAAKRRSLIWPAAFVGTFGSAFALAVTLGLTLGGWAWALLGGFAGLLLFGFLDASLLFAARGGRRPSRTFFFFWLPIRLVMALLLAWQVRQVISCVLFSQSLDAAQRRMPASETAAPGESEEEPPPIAGPQRRAALAYLDADLQTTALVIQWLIFAVTLPVLFLPPWTLWRVVTFVPLLKIGSEGQFDLSAPFRTLPRKPV